MKKSKVAIIIVLLLAISVLVVYISKVIKGEETITLEVFAPTTTTTTTIPTTTESEEERLARERAEQEAIAQSIRDNTVYIGFGVEGYKVLSVEEVEIQGEGEAEARVERRVVAEEPFPISEKMALYSTGVSDGYYELKLDYYAEDIYAYVLEKDVHLSLADFMEQPEADCDYGYFPKNKDFEGNPRVKVHGVYLTESSFRSEKLEEVLSVLRETDLNAIVVDIKNDSEELLFHSDAAEKYNPRANEYATMTKEEVQQLVKKAKAEGVYLIARIVTFKSPIYSADHSENIIKYTGTNRPFTEGGSSLYWTSPADRDLWEYNVMLAEEAADLGFQEIQFDYVRFPAVPPTVGVDYNGLGDRSKTHVVQEFLKFAYGRLTEKKVYVSADIFGWSATATDDTGIGQHWEAMANVCDYVCPMLYPSHYGKGVFGITYPDTRPYEVLLAAGTDCLNRNSNIVEPAIIRPWIQDFTAEYISGQGLEYIPYGKKEIQDQVRALAELGIDEYLLWNPSNYYTVDKFQ